MDLFTNEHFGMKEPQPLGANNVMFPFILLLFAAGFSLIIGLAEKCFEKKMSSSPSSATDVAERGIKEGPSQPLDNIPEYPDSPDVNSRPHQEIEVSVTGYKRG